MFRAAIGGEKEDGSKKFVIRPYTPTSPKDAKGYFDLVVKVYEQGKMSKHFGELKVLICLDCCGQEGLSSALLMHSHAISSRTVRIQRAMSLPDSHKVKI